MVQRASFGEAPRAIAASLSLLEGAIRFQLASMAGDGRMIDFGDSHALAGYSPRTLELAAARRIILDDRDAPLAMTPCQARELCAGMYGSFGIYVDPWRISPVLATLSAELAALAANCTASAPAEPLGSATVAAFLDGGFAALRVPLMAVGQDLSAPPPCFAPNDGRAEPFCIDRAMPSLADAIPYSLLAMNGRPSSFIKSEIDFGTVTWSAWGSRLLSEFGYGTIATTQGGDDTRRMAWLDNSPAGHNTVIVREAFQSAAHGASEDEINFSQFNFVAGQMRVANVSRRGDGGGGAGGGGRGDGGQGGGGDACILLDGSDVYGAARPDGWLDVMRRYACPLSEGDTPAFMLLDVLKVKANRARLTLDGDGNGGPAYNEATPAHATLHCEEFFYTETAAVLATDGSGSPIAQELPFDTEVNPRSSRCGHVDVSTLGADADSVLLRPRCGLGEHRDADGVASISGFASSGGSGHFVIDGLVTAPDRWLTPHSHQKRRFRFVTEAPTGVGGDVRAFVLAPAAAHNRSAPPVVRLTSCTAAIGCAVGTPLLSCTCIELCTGSVLRWAIVMQAELVALHAVGTCDAASSTPDAALAYRARLATLGSWPMPPSLPPLPPLPPPRDGSLEVQHKVRIRFTAAGSVSEFDEERRSQVRASLAQLASVKADDVELTITAASVLVSALITVADAPTASSVASSLGAQLASTTAATSQLGVQVESVPSIDAIVVAAPGPPPQDPGNAVPVATIGAAIGGAAALLIFAGIALCWRRRGSRRTKAFSSSPSCVHNKCCMQEGTPATSPSQPSSHTAQQVL